MRAQTRPRFRTLFPPTDGRKSPARQLKSRKRRKKKSFLPTSAETLRGLFLILSCRWDERLPPYRTAARDNDLSNSLLRRGQKTSRGRKEREKKGSLKLSGESAILSDSIRRAMIRVSTSSQIYIRDHYDPHFRPCKRFYRRCYRSIAGYHGRLSCLLHPNREAAANSIYYENFS